ncbi:MAG TPA: response regulator [Syntrophomonadaceae bacterium]|nr:response regulator [Syntrophomonadaceae bacterium]
MEYTILIVDDQKGVRRLLEELFKKESWQVYLASDGLEAIDMAQELKPDIILMDMKMPNMDGLEAAEKILAIDQDQYIVIMTAYGEMEIVNKILEVGVKKCIAKPFDIMVLRDLVKEMVLNKNS